MQKSQNEGVFIMIKTIKLVSKEPIEGITKAKIKDILKHLKILTRYYWIMYLNFALCRAMYFILQGLEH